MVRIYDIVREITQSRREFSRGLKLKESSRYLARTKRGNAVLSTRPDEQGKSTEYRIKEAALMAW